MNNDAVENYNSDDSLLETNTKYEKLGDAGIKGVLFQINLLTVFMLNALEKTTNWRLSTENKVGAKFDDIIFEYSNEAILLQAKHRKKANYKVTYENLLSVNSKNDDFSLPKYFFSYHEVKSKFKAVKSVIICTNADIDVDEGKIKARSLTAEDMLYFEGTDKICHTFQEIIINDLEKRIRLYYGKNLKGKNICEDIICEKNIKDFLNHLHFVAAYPSGNALKNIIENKISQSKFGKNLNYKIASTFIFNEMIAWYEREKGIYLNPISSSSIFCKMVSYKYCESLEKYEIFFENNDFIANNSKKIIHVIPRTEYLLYIIKVYRALLEEDTLFVPSDEEDSIQCQILEAFELPPYKYLVIVRPKPITQNDNKIYSKIQKSLVSNWKRVVLIAQKEDNIAKRLKNDHCTFYRTPNDTILFTDLAKETRKMFLDKLITLQGKPISIGTLLKEKDSMNRVLTSNVLAKLARNEDISIGREIGPLNPAYISRKFRGGVIYTEDARNENISIGREIGPLNPAYISRKFRKGVIYTEDEILEQRIVLISASAGMGKSTVLKKLSVILKEKFPYLWIIPVDLNSYTKILTEFQKEGSRLDLNILELLNSEASTRLKNEMEYGLFSVQFRVALMVDAVDEISPTFTDIVFLMLQICRNCRNFAKIFVTTRPHLKQELMSLLTVAPTDLHPFSQRDQLIFLKNYWIQNLNIKDPALENKCEYYSEVLVNNLSKLINHNPANEFGGNPLQTRMLAEVFQEKTSWNSEELEEWEFCKEFIMSNNREPKIPKKINFVKLYKLFIDKKCNIFVEEKANPNRNIMAEEALKANFKHWYDFHYILAIDNLLDRSRLPLFTCCGDNKNPAPHENLFKVGIVERVGYDFRFIHRTFAEYFLAECIVRELKTGNKTEDFYIFLMDQIFIWGNYLTVRFFIDNFLKDQSSLLSQVDICDRTSILNFNSEVLHSLSREGQTEILRFVINNFSQRKETRFFKRKLRNKAIDIDVKDPGGRTPLHDAAEKGHLDTVQFLIEQGADVNNTDCYYNKTPLLEATHEGHFDVVKYLVANGANVNSKDKGGYTPLIEACRKRNFLMAWFLAEAGAECDVEANGVTVLQQIVFSNHWKLVKYVLVKGADVNAKDRLGGTLLHIAIDTNNLIMAKVLLKYGANIDAASDGNWVVGSRFGWEELHRHRRIKSRFVYDHMGGFTSLHLAVGQNNWRAVKLLIDNGANVNVTDRCGCTPLHVAVRKENTTIVKILVEKSADPNIQDSFGRTPLHDALFNINVANFALYNLLVKNGGDQTVKDQNGVKPLDYLILAGLLNTS